MRIHYDGLALPVSSKFVHQLQNLLTKNEIESESVILNSRDRTYSAKRGGYHPVEISLEQYDDTWHFCYITDFAYVGSRPYAELIKELDFDFQSGVFQNLFGVFPTEQAQKYDSVSNFIPNKIHLYFCTAVSARRKQIW